jgi:hypothetical protein
MTRFAIALGVVLLATLPSSADDRLAIGLANHAFDHLSNIGEQAPAAVASGCNIIYATGVGSLGYAGLPAPTELDKASRDAAAYLVDAKKRGIKLAIGYVCATSIVKLDTFDKNWTNEFRQQFSTPPKEWLQRDRNNKPLSSWYGGDYLPACMSNPDWRRYEKAIVRKQLGGGCDGIFFDNPTVHPQGCYCDGCMKQFAAFIGASEADVAAARAKAIAQPKDFERFRCTVARDFLADIRAFARTIKPDALITCNNSLNAPDAFFSQCKAYGYNIYEMSKAEDFVVLEDMATQPRMLANGNTVEYGAVYDAVKAIAHYKPVVACVLADGDYHTPPNLVRLAMAEAGAHDASYLSWPTWPADQRERMAAAIRPQSDFLRDHADLLKDAIPATELLIYLPFRRWQETSDCKLLACAGELARKNVQYRIVCEDDFEAALRDSSAPLLIESKAAIRPEELQAIESKSRPVVTADRADWLAVAVSAAKSRNRGPLVLVEGASAVRAIVRDQPGKRLVHLLNLNVKKTNSFEDQVAPAAVHILLRSGMKQVQSVKYLTADDSGDAGKFTWEEMRISDGADLKMTIPKLVVSGLLVVEGK